ncbi:MAG: hypothetical protein QN133_10845 [Armatimonadota bacterium]|nr:hypothetical protein [Armatimonadota bacterium]MDR7447556.1 hypothetical protein [Armatimonadota bacterium]MDR7541026.1 hypothetical protein [Armatimonadota bacterium]MDR7566144.1 hypothetical protein [Armatimonadota bacterium]MDR7577450.1 hypothetical protein [Armatimonadota bacterium]
MTLKDVLRENWRRAMPLRAARPRGVRARPREEEEQLALRWVAYRQARRAFSTWIRKEGPRAYRLVVGSLR